jgi:hypothetical protein
MRLTRMLAGLGVLVLVAAGCGSSSSGSSSGVSDQQFVDALNLDTVGGGYTVKGTLCGVDRFLHNSDEVSKANTTQKGSVLASHDQTLGIVIIPPFTNGCAKDAQQELNKLARSQR